MGIFDFFMKNARKTASYEQKSSIDEINSSSNPMSSTDSITHSPEDDWIFTQDSTTRVFPDINPDTGHIEYYLSRISKSGKEIQLGRILEIKEGEHLRDIVEAIDHAIDSPRAFGGTSSSTIKKLRIHSTSVLKKLAKTHNIAFSKNINTVFEHITPKSQILLNSDLASSSPLDYSSLSDLPTQVNSTALSPQEIRFYGRSLSQRLEELSAIKTPEDAYAQREVLSNFMRSKEDTFPSQLLGLLPQESELSEDNPHQAQNMSRRDIILECAKALENIPNEDGLLYSSYLKLEENRVLSKIQQDLQTYGRNHPDKQNEVATFVEQIEQSKLAVPSEKGTPDYESSASIVDYMMENILNNSIEKYLKTGLRQDLILKGFLNRNPDVPNSQTITDYLHTKMSSYGQVTPIPADKTLRSFIETTDYKTPDVTQAQNFLYTIAQIEKMYIEQQYTPLLVEYRKMLDPQKGVSTQDTISQKTTPSMPEDHGDR